MSCTELEALEIELIRIRAASRNLRLLQVREDALEDAEVEKIMAIKDHRCFGHNGEACFGE